ncbi:uncharacterized protein YfaS (alpha-2-macroglobulin family) [Parabacteroides sp. PF5-5]|uniref:alpha-2-macroglobulin family protein n=1 Tax=unclassified Parabacteroides TaxID=2649774 RepID=UPI002476F657|nr:MULTISPECIES: alpha-2-macroglobulin family protein [unclassified Parabacteroides]MDH6306643.1 uncharacterized protein YfaS (alpha-2-macroglobulin family) [Parabacteroides sp. PH5-39]MDH6317610.1 uncharacterized protein YfaS (alpha-2-macroglobulin family) [Parabacteroides sp. PF5-13]MDH6321354.1 uncharacterized protein YfaS (alpha-2-macroglobulin family) [Parabacteroides sp. PH5-13]MDH6325081.1 uncharacterized protein YfaS (alpha-2-macroglobulin family) [Parabacteroides sp. PH5-8]MDH6328790.
MNVRIIIAVTVMLCSSILSSATSAARISNNSTTMEQITDNSTPPLFIKNLISQMKERKEVDEDIFPSLIDEINSHIKQMSNDPISVAILHSMSAEMYNTYYQQNRWRIDRRTPIQGYIPEDIREWTSNLFTQKIKEELEASLQPVSELQRIPATAFKEILKTGKDSPALRPTLYELLAYRAIDIQPVESIYKELLTYLAKKHYQKSTVLAELNYLQSQYTRTYQQAEQDKYEASIDSLLAIHADEDYSVEIVAAKLNLLQNKTYRSASPDSIQDAAYRLCKETIARYPKYERIGIITNRLAEMEEARIQSQGNSTVYPGQNLELKLTYTNIPKITIKVYKSLKPIIDKNLSYSENKENTLGEFVKEVSFPLQPKNSYASNDTSLQIRMDAPGLYEYVITVPGKELKISNPFSVTRLASASRTTVPGKTEILVTDYQTGKPIHQSTVNYYTRTSGKYVKKGSIKTDKDGLGVLPNSKDIAAYQVNTSGDESSFITSVYTGRRIGDEDATRTEVVLLTDRGLYRPGQTLYFKGIAYKNDRDNPQVVPNKSFSVSLRDANYKEISNKTFTSNTFGSFTGEFTLPQQTLTGTFTLQTDNGSVSVQVEEYKRPTFKIDLLPVKEEIAFGDEVTIQGKAQTFSGVMLQSGEITYRIVRAPFWFRVFYDNYNEEQVAEGKALLNSDGTFSFSFRPEKSEQSFPLTFNSYNITVTLTDSKGETQEARSTVSVGDRSIILQAEMKSQLEKESPGIKVKAITLNGEEVQTEGTYTICTLDDTKKENVYKEGKEVAHGTFSTRKAFDKNIFARVPSGRYRICLTAKDSKGRTITEQQDFILYSKQDKRPPVFSHIWMLEENTTCLPGEDAKIIFGTSDKNVYVLYELITNKQVISRERLELSNEVKTFNIPFKESYGDAVTVSFTFIKEGKLYNQLSFIRKKLPNKQLTIKPETFRDRLLPGSSESWKFRILGADSLAVPAEILAEMYDASLDKIMPFAWTFAPSYYPVLNYSRFTESDRFRYRSGYSSQQVKYATVPEFAYDYLDWQGLLDFARLETLSGAAPSMRSMNQYAKSADMADDMVLNEAVVEQDAESGGMPVPGQGQGKGVNSPSSDLQIRTNFNETAFFFPTLRTDKDGNVTVNFNIPESNTTWKLQTLAHTADLQYGLLTNEVITQKPLMVLPNLPRFVRSGDELTISTQVMNLSDKETSGVARLELFNPVNEQAMAFSANAQQPFALKTDGTTAVSWIVNIPEGIDLLGVRIIAESEAGSDGEQHLLPVLPNEVLVTESTPFYLLEEGEKQIRLSGNTNSGKPYAMTLEYSSNPVWYAVQALPTVTQPTHDNVVSWFASYYSSTLALSIAQSNPRIKQIIEQWAAQGNTASTLLSNLEKNEELKNVLLEETPWVMEAKNETEQKQRLSLLFDTNRTTQIREAALRVLLEQQQEDGGWGWYKGFYPDRTITLFILDGMTQLVRLSAVQYGQEEKEMQMKALRYLDSSIQKDYEMLMKAKMSSKDHQPSPTQLDFLYVRSQYRDIPELGSAREAIRYFTNQAEKHWEKASLLGKGKTALLMHRNGKKEVANKILTWLRKTATTTEDKGMYWANNKRENNYFVSPVNVHCLLMSVFHEINSNTKETDKMKQWLLNQKRTQNWGSAPVTLDAIYSILATGSDWLTDSNTSVIRWGDKTLNPSDGELATGYVKETVNGKEITPSMRTVTVKKKGKAPAWGALYHQYFEAIDKVNKQKGVLNVEKKLFIESNSGTQRQITPVTDAQPLRKGDKVIVRLTIRTDRDLDYVYLKDLRAGCFEPADQLSGIMFRDGLLYYHAPKDVSENFYFDHLRAGTYVLEYPAYVSRSGQYSGGLATIQCLYAPEFVSHTEGTVIQVNE